MINPVEYKEKFTNLVSALGRHTGGTTPTVNDNGVSFFWLSDMLFSFILSDPDVSSILPHYQMRILTIRVHCIFIY